MSSNLKIAIVGGGVSGLIAAQCCERIGHQVHLFEKEDALGGRVQTDVEAGYLLDRGFQVLLDAYPLAKKYLDYDALQLKPFLPGALVMRNGKRSKLGDPLRDASFLIPTLFSEHATLSDKWKIFRLSQSLKQKSLAAIFSEPEQSTLQYLKSYGFSAKVITRFFEPFFAGIFLEPRLSTSSRMFEFVYKMFSEGSAVIPKDGMGAISNYLADQLTTTDVHLKTAVDHVDTGVLKLSDGTKVEVDAIILATASQALMPARGKEIAWKSCETFYFETEECEITEPIIGLVPEKDALINTVHYPTQLQPSQKGQHHLLSVTVLKEHDLNEQELHTRVLDDLKQFCGITPTRLLKKYTIEKALPDLKSVAYEPDQEQIDLAPGIFAAGDVLLNGSLNAAMLAGERAAERVFTFLKSS
ncbi:protoporphyrinogen/coproporphyrinogen oxidase [Croceiramulus getboli]|nr:NAD(P)/FAD-dependent oxidoreductase [Flavobacteriaceae bacterium YJPT1-3]